MRYLKYLFFVIAFGSFFPCRIWGQPAFSFLLLSPGPRASALGESYTALAEDAETLFYNSSGLSFQKTKQLHFQSFLPPLIEGINSHNLTYVQPVRNGAWGLQAGGLHIHGITRTVSDPHSEDGYRETGEFSASGIKISGAFGKKIAPSLGIGAVVGWIQESLSDETAGNVFADMGLLYRSSFRPFRLGCSIQNLGPRVQFKDLSSDMPTVFRAGIAVAKTDDFPIPLLPFNTIITGEYFKPFRGTSALQGGLEIPLGKSIFLRGGYRHFFKQQQTGSQGLLPGGLSLGLGLLLREWNLDYSCVSWGELGLNHRLALSLKWDRSGGLS